MCFEAKARSCQHADDITIYFLRPGLLTATRHTAHPNVVDCLLVVSGIAAAAGATALQLLRARVRLSVRLCSSVLVVGTFDMFCVFTTNKYQ